MSEFAGPYVLKPGVSWWYWFYTNDWEGSPGGASTQQSAWEKRFHEQSQDLFFVVRPSLKHLEPGQATVSVQSNRWGLHVARTEVVLESKWTPGGSEQRYSHRVQVENATGHEMEFYIVIHRLN